MQSSWELKGDIHAFSDPDSNSGYLVTCDLLAQRGLRPDDFFRRTFFTYSHRNVVRAVASGLAESGSVDGYVWEVLNELDPPLTSATRVLRKSELLGFPPIAVLTAQLGNPVVEKLKAALIGMAADAEGKKVLRMLRLDAFASDRVMTRLGESQERHLRELSGAYLDGLSSSLQPAVLQEDVWEVFDGLDRAKALYAGLDAVLTIVMNPDSRVIASSVPASFPTGSAVPPSLLERFKRGKLIQADYHAGKGYAFRELTLQGRPIGSIYTELDISRILAERVEARRVLLLTNGLLTLGLAALGYLVVRRAIAPLNTLSHHLGRGIEGELTPVPDRLLGSPKSEFGYLLRRYNALAVAVNERRQYADQLAENEKLASLGRVASGLAHEINNPLGGMLNTVNALKRHGREPGVLAESIEILERGLRSIRDVVRATLLTYRSNLFEHLAPGRFRRFEAAHQAGD